MLPPAPPLLSTTNGWPKAAGELVADQAAHRVGAAARRERHDQADGLGGPGRLRAAIDGAARAAARRLVSSSRFLDSVFIENTLPARDHSLLARTEYLATRACAPT